MTASSAANLHRAVVERGTTVVTSTLLVPWWSFTKTVLAATALTLVRDGVLALDALLPGEPYTLRQLLQHTAGVANYAQLPDYHAAVERDDEPWPVAELLQRCRAHALCFPPGQGWQYSNIGYLRVRQIIEANTGLPLHEALSRAVLQPLGIEGARLAVERADLCGVDMGVIPNRIEVDRWPCVPRRGGRRQDRGRDAHY